MTRKVTITFQVEGADDEKQVELALKAQSIAHAVLDFDQWLRRLDKHSEEDKIEIHEVRKKLREELENVSHLVRD
jgi:hypothetical protein